MKNKDERQIAKEKIAMLGQALIECLSYSAIAAVNDIYKDEMLMYDECIKQYYSYKTTSYRRHEVGVGTCTGVNLYRSSNFKVRYKTESGILSSVELPCYIDAYEEVNANDMEGYRSWKDKDGNRHEVDKEAVLQYVLDGYRGVDADGAFGNTGMTWTADVKSKYLGSFTGTPNEIFEKYEDDIVDVCRSRAERYYRINKNNYINKIK